MTVASAARSKRNRAPVGVFARTFVLALAVAAVLATGAAGCGTYSNEDLEFMSAVPQESDLAVSVPARAAALTTTAAAEGWQTTYRVTQTLNGVAASFLGLIDKVRSYYPTSRAANERIWGPFPSDDYPGWQNEFRMTRALDKPEFTYALVMIPPADVVLPNGAGELQIMGGSFAAAGGARRGMGQLSVTIDGARAAGIVFPGLERLVRLDVVYDTRTWPRSITMTIMNLPPLDPTKDAMGAMYTYSRTEAGDSTMTFSFDQNAIGPASSPSETMMISSHWLVGGPGRWDVSITGGDSVGLASPPTLVECWDDHFASTYRNPSWDSMKLTGDPTSCIPQS